MSFVSKNRRLTGGFFKKKKENKEVKNNLKYRNTYLI